MALRGKVAPRELADMRRFAALLLLVTLAACAQPAMQANMVASPAAPLPATSRWRNSVAVGTVVGGEPTHPLWVSRVGNAEFTEALRTSLGMHGLAGERLQVDAALQNLAQPFVGLDMTVTATAQYRVTERATGRVVFDQVITTPFTANFSSQLYGVERLRAANEGAIRANIAAFIAALMSPPAV